MIILFRFNILISCLLMCCTATEHPDSTTAVTSELRSLTSFQFIGPQTTLPQVIATVGQPDQDVGSGIHIYEYALVDGTRIWIGSSDNFHIMYIKHGANLTNSETLYPKANYE